MPLDSVLQPLVGRLALLIFTVRPGFAWQGLWSSATVSPSLAGSLLVYRLSVQAYLASDISLPRTPKLCLAGPSVDAHAPGHSMPLGSGMLAGLVSPACL
jgi:hypothetical protein